MPTDPSITPNAAPSEGPGSRQEPADGSNGAQEVPGAERPAQSRSGDSRSLRARLAHFADPSLAPRDLLTPPTPPAAHVSAEECPEAAGEPESGERRPPGREAPLDRTRRYLVPVAALKLPGHPNDRHLAVYEWLPQCDAWATGPALCGYSTRQGALPDSMPITCAECLERRPDYERYLERDRDRQATVRELDGKDTVAVPRWEYELMTQQQERAAQAEATIERMKRTNRMVNGGARDSRERAERAEADLEALRLKVADLERIAAGPQPPEQDSTGWQWLCHRCKHGADGHFTRRSAMRAQRKHLAAAHR